MSWNKPSSAPQPPPKKSTPPSLKRGLLAGLLVIVLGALGLYLFSNGEATSSSRQKKERGRIKEVTPAAAKQEKPVEKPVEKKQPHYWELPTTNGLTETQIRKWKFMHEPPPPWTNTVMATRKRPKYAIFDTRPENEIAGLISATPGASLVGMPRYSEKFKADFLKSCETPIIVSKDDDEYTANLKREMNKVKIELRQRMADGEDLGDILTETRRELQNLAAVKREVEREMRKVIKDTAVTEEDVDTCIEAANKLLESKGVAPVRMNPLLRSALKRSIQDRPAEN